MIIFLFIQMIHGMWIRWIVLVFLSNTTISMILPDSSSIFTAEIWAIIKTLQEIMLHPNIVFTDSVSCPQALQFMKLEHPLIGMVIRKSVSFKNVLPIKILLGI